MRHRGDVLNNFDPDAVEATVARLLLAFTMIFTYPMEALVARHVLIQLLYDGNIDGDENNNNGNDKGMATSWFCCNRRIIWTLVIYLATLIPALIVDDLGPVLSITGALGGCCLAYIGPGLVYLGINGDSFLEYVLSILKNHQGYYFDKLGSTIDDGESYVTMNNHDTNNVVDDHDEAAIWAGNKPWWWYPLGMPLWIKVATTGFENMKERLENMEEKEQQGRELNSAETSIQQQQRQMQDDTETIVPVKGDYYMSIFFVVFGLIACVAGLVSNLLVQVL